MLTDTTVATQLRLPRRLHRRSLPEQNPYHLPARKRGQAVRRHAGDGNVVGKCETAIALSPAGR